MKKYSLLILFLALSASPLFAQVLDVESFSNKITETPQALLLDVRTSGEFGGGHLPKATNIDFRSEGFSKEIDKLDKSKPVLIYCLSGGRSAQAAEMMRAKGFQVTELKGGYIDMNDIRTTNNTADKAEQHFWFLQRIIAFGGIFRI